MSNITPIQQIKTAMTHGDFSAAISVFKNAEDSVKSESDKQEMLYLAAVSFRQLKQFEEAERCANTLLKLNEQHSRAYQELGYLYSAVQKIRDAAKAFYEATRRNPALLSAWRALIPLYKQLDNHQAWVIAQQQVDYLQSLPKQILGARDLFYEGQIQLADQVCRQFLQANKHHVEGMLLLSEIAVQLKVYSEAEFLLESSFKLHPTHISTGMEYLKLLAKMGKFQATKDIANQLLTVQSDNPNILTAKATAMVGLGELDDAVELYVKLIDDDSRPNLWLLLGHAYKAQGNIVDAVKAYQKAYKMQPDFGDAYWSLANTKTYRFDETEIQKMSALTEDSSVAVNDRVHLMFALGKALEDRQDYESSFFSYSQGNQLKQAQLQYDPVFIERQVESQIQHVNQSLFDKVKNSGVNVGESAQDPIFIVGLPRSGSTLLEQILASHSQVDGTMELHNILGLVARLRNQKTTYPSLLNELDLKYFQRFGQQYLKETQVYRGSAPLFIDKMPNNFVHIGLIKLILPNAKVIDARRQPMACCFSGFKQLFGEGQEFSYSLENIGRYYKAYTKLMTHWDQVLPNFVLRVQHEDVINDLDGQVKRILDFCGLPFEQQCIDFHQTQRVIKTPSSEQVRQPIYRSGMQQWKNFESSLTPLKRIVADLNE